MTKFDSMLELEEKINNAAKECSDRLWNKKWAPKQDMLAAAFIEGVKWLARESMKEQAKQDEQLPRAKEIITSLLNVFVYDLADDEMDTGSIDTKIKAEQFLREVSNGITM